MRKLFTLILLFSSLLSQSQKTGSSKKKSFAEKEKYLSMNFFSMAEPQFALGPSAGIRFSERSEVFAELAYVTRTPFYGNNEVSKLNGARLIIQYRYHFLQQWKPLLPILGDRRHLRERHQPFIGFEWRMKPISFSTTGSFVNETTGDTLNHYPFQASSFTYGGALIFGQTFNLSADDRWKLEITAGIGAKERTVRLKTVPPGYKTNYPPPREWYRVPLLQEELSTVLLPFAIRLRYVID